MNGYIWVTNGTDNVRVYVGQEIPPGYEPGITMQPRDMNHEAQSDKAKKGWRTRKANGKGKPWNIGINKQSDPRVARIANKTRELMKSGRLHSIGDFAKGRVVSASQREAQSKAAKARHAAKRESQVHLIGRK